jgi:hypothetical protein
MIQALLRFAFEELSLHRIDLGVSLILILQQFAVINAQASRQRVYNEKPEK